MATLETYWTTEVEPTARDLYRRFRWVWVDRHYITQAVYRPSRTELCGVPFWNLRVATDEPNIDTWVRIGGVLLQHHAFQAPPPTKALFILDCPLDARTLDQRAIQARQCLVVRLPASWLLHERKVYERYPGGAACRNFHEWLISKHQRMQDDEAAFVEALGHELDSVCAVRADEFENASACGRAAGLVPDVSPFVCYPVSLMLAPDPRSPLALTYKVIQDSARKVAGWHVVTDDLWPRRYPWVRHLRSLQGLGCLQQHPELLFFSVAKPPQFDRAQEMQEEHLKRLRQVIAMVKSWPEYPRGTPRPLRKPRRARSAAQPAGS